MSIIKKNTKIKKFTFDINSILDIAQHKKAAALLFFQIKFK
jgi:hypothetical protein